jgi:lysophospholipase I
LFLEFNHLNHLFFTRYDVRSFAAGAPDDEEGMLESSDKIKALIAEEIASGMPPDRIVLGGFSQGGAMTLLTGMTTEMKLAGLIVMSGRLPIREKIKAVRASYNPSATGLRHILTVLFTF